MVHSGDARAGSAALRTTARPFEPEGRGSGCRCTAVRATPCVGHALGLQARPRPVGAVPAHSLKAQRWGHPRETDRGRSMTFDFGAALEQKPRTAGACADKLPSSEPMSQDRSAWAPKGVHSTSHARINPSSSRGSPGGCTPRPVRPLASASAQGGTRCREESACRVHGCQGGYSRFLCPSP